MVNITRIPTAQDWFDNMPNVYKIFIFVSAVFLIICLVLAFKQIYNIHWYISNEQIQTDMYYIILMPTVVCGCCLFGNTAPRSASVLYGVGLMYMMLTLYTVYNLIMKSFGGTENLSRRLKRDHTVVKFNTMPFCCCCVCLPTVQPTPRNLNRIQWFVIQTPIVRITVQIAIIIFTLDGIDASESGMQILSGVSIISMLIALYACHVVVSMLKEDISPMGIIPLFRMVDISQGLYQAQKFIIDMVSNNHDLDDDFILPSVSIGIYWHNVVMTLVMALISIIIFRFVSPGRAKVFDLYGQPLPRTTNPPNVISYTVNVDRISDM